MDPNRIQKIKKNARRSWSAEFRGKQELEVTDGLSEETFPFWVLAKQIDLKENLLVEFEDNPYRKGIVENHLLEAKLSFVFRYQWKFSTQYPFGASWIYRKYKKLISERRLRHCLNS